ncbi:MAG TPA: DegV family protein [Herpetosiphonaceae bacterium]|nr:DegV family protein [Herpetosiphonaceae bacterium]
MAAIALVTASAASLPAEILDRYRIHLIPFVVQFVDGNYREDADLSLDDFYRRLEASEVVPSTAPTSVAQFIQYFERQHPEADTIVVFHVGTQTSKAYENALQAAARVPGRRIVNVDTHSFSMGSGLQIIEAAKAFESGASVEDVLTLIKELAPRTLALFTPPSLRYLRMSGRVGRVPALAASLMGIQPILGLNPDGKMDVLARSRSAEAARATMLERAAEFLGAKRPRSLAVIHINAVEAGRALQNELERLYPGVPVYLNDAGPILAVHSGPGTVGLAVLRDE